MPRDRLKILAEGIFFSTLNYCIPVYGNVWGLTEYSANKSTAFTKDDNRKLQVLVNKVLRSLTGLPYDTPVSQLVAASGQLSVHQRTAYHTLTSMYKTIKSGLPRYSRDRLEESRAQTKFRIECRLSLSRCSYFYRGSRLLNQLPDDFLEARTIQIFKKKVKAWVKRSIPVLPP